MELMKYHSLKDIENKVPKPGSFKHFLQIQENGGRVVKGVNTTADVGVDAIKKQAAKFGNKVDKDGRPPTLSKKVKGSKTNVLFNLGLAESIDWVKLRNAKAVMPYALDSPEQRAKGLMPDAGSPNIYTSINLRTKLPAGYDAREFSKKEVSDQAWQKYMDGAWLGLKKVKKDQIKQAAKLAQIPIKEKTLDNTDESMLYYAKMAEDLGELASTSKVFVDMDGVLADFFGEWQKLIGKDWRKVKDIEPALQKIRDTDDFFLNLPLLPQAKNLLGVIKKVKGSYSILSSPLPNDPNSEPHKREWIKKNLDFFPPENVIITHDKAKFATNSDGTPNILIDDFGKNIASWEAAGGEGFKHKDHKFERTAKAIQQHMKEPVEEAPEDEINKMKQTGTAIQKAQSMMKPRYMPRIAAMVEEDFEAIRDAAIKRYKKANGKIDLYTAYTMAIEDEFPEIPNPIVVFQYMTDPIPDHEDLVPQDAEDGSWADRADKEYQQNPKGGGFDPLIKGRWFAIRRDRDDYMDQGMEPEDALDKAAERHGVDPEEVEKWLAAGNAVKMKEMTEKAVSKKQQQFFGIVSAMQKGDMKKGGEAGEVAKDMKKSDVKKFASTKHKGLPKKKKSESYTRDQLPQIRKKHLEYIPHKIVSIKVESIVPVQKERLKENYTKQLKKIAGGEYAPIIVDSTNRIINGHHRYDVVKMLQMESISVAKLPYTLEFVLGMMKENFADGKKKGKSRPGRVKKSGASCNGSVTSLRSKAKKASGERAKMYHWCANMKSGRKKSESLYTEQEFINILMESTPKQLDEGIKDLLTKLPKNILSKVKPILSKIPKHTKNFILVPTLLAVMVNAVAAGDMGKVDTQLDKLNNMTTMSSTMDPGVDIDKSADADKEKLKSNLPDQIKVLKMPTPPDAPSADTKDGTADNGVSTQTDKDGNRTVSSGAGTYTFTPDGKLIKYETPKIGGLQQVHDLVKKVVTVDYSTSVNTGDGDVGVDQKGTYDMSGKLIDGKGIKIGSGNFEVGIDQDGHKNFKYDAGAGKVYKGSTSDMKAAKKTLGNMQKDLNIAKDKSAPYSLKTT